MGLKPLELSPLSLSLCGFVLLFTTPFISTFHAVCLPTSLTILSQYLSLTRFFFIKFKLPYTQPHRNPYTHRDTHKHTCTHTHTQVHTYSHATIHTHTLIYIYIHIYSHIYTHAYLCTHMHVLYYTGRNTSSCLALPPACEHII